jgi:retron-type reverse transcriptase
LKLFEPDKNPLHKLSSLDSLCTLLDVQQGQLLYICYRRLPQDKYTSFEIPKKRGGVRRIDAPKKGLGLIQKRLATLLSEQLSFKSCVKGFVKEEGICKNALLHKKSNWVLNVDIQDFFGSINFGRVRAAFLAKPFEMSNEVATVIAQICTYENRLPQGAPTSPVVANIIASMLDNKVIRLVQKYRLTYSRYADDMTISARRSFPKELAYTSEGKTILGEDLKNVFERARFEVNPNKSRLQPRYSRQEVTGLIVNKKTNIPVEYKNKLRSAIKQWIDDPKQAEKKYYIEIRGEDEKDFVASEDGARLKTNIYGRLSFMAMVKGRDDPTYINLILKMAQHDNQPPKFVQKIKGEHKMYDVFLCHASEDKEAIVRPLYEELQKLGLNVFLDSEEIGWGESLIDIINKALHKSKYVIAVMSDNSVGKKWPQKEINAVLNSEITNGTNKLLPLINGNAEDILSENFLLSDKLYKAWDNNPAEIAAEILKLVQKNKQ